MKKMGLLSSDSNPILEEVIYFQLNPLVAKNSFI